MIRNVTSKWCLVGLSGLVVSCSHLDRRGNGSQTGANEPVVQTEKAVRDESLSPSASDRPGYKPLAHYSEVRLDVNKKVLQWIDYYQTRGRSHMERYLSRSTKYLPKIKKVLRKNGMPEDLSYLVLIESGFNPVAHSHAAAVGFWQFIGGTGTRYGLKINRYVDERMDLERSSEAASKYLGDLYGMFGDWHLSLAAYNTGEGRVKRVIRRFRTKDFWKIMKKRRRSLARETKNYVPKYIAATLIAKNPERYGFKNIEYQQPYDVETINLNQSISMEKLAKNLSVPYDSIKKLNPMYRSDFVPVHGDISVALNIPSQLIGPAKGVLQASVSDRPLRKFAPGYNIYRVRRGDSLSRIAQKYRTRVSTLRRLNRLRRRSFIRVGQRLKVPNRYGRTVAVRPNKRPTRRVSKPVAVQRSKKSSSISSNGTHKIRRGENLTLIANRYGVTVNQLRKWNGIGRRFILRPGRKLYVKPVKGRIHLVRRGENLSVIARRYRVTVSKLASINDIGKGARIHIGTSLVIPD